jgi:hypothetical protein
MIFTNKHINLKIFLLSIASVASYYITMWSYFPFLSIQFNNYVSLWEYFFPILPIALGIVCLKIIRREKDANKFVKVISGIFSVLAIVLGLIEVSYVMFGLLFMLG